MQAIVLNQENEFPKYQTVADPKPGDGELLVKVEYAGMNYADTMIRRGFYLQKPSFPSVLGFEYSGTVVGIGNGARPHVARGTGHGVLFRSLRGVCRDSGASCHSCPQEI